MNNKGTHTHTAKVKSFCINKKSMGILKTASACRLQVSMRDVLLISNPLYFVLQTPVCPRLQHCCWTTLSVCKNVLISRSACSSQFISSTWHMWPATRKITNMALTELTKWMDACLMNEALLWAAVAESGWQNFWSHEAFKDFLFGLLFVVLIKSQVILHHREAASFRVILKCSWSSMLTRKDIPGLRFETAKILSGESVKHSSGELKANQNRLNFHFLFTELPPEGSIDVSLMLPFTHKSLWATGNVNKYGGKFVIQMEVLFFSFIFFYHLRTLLL